MMKILANDKIYYVQQYLNGNMSQRSIADATGVALSSVQQWIRNYESMGTDAFRSNGYKHYSKTLKESAVKDYLAGLGSQDDICKKYQILSKSKLQKWIKMYNNHEELKSSGTGGKRIMDRGRTTTFDERVSIVEDCIANDHNYAVVAKKHKVSYQQVYTWVKKYKKNGIEALKDHRGRTKPVEEMSELEKLRYENRMLKAEKLQQQMEIDFLKKVEEIERRRF